MKLLRSTKNETTKEGNGENVPRSEITLVALVLCSIVNNDCQQNTYLSYIYLFLINPLVNCYVFCLNILHF